ERDYYLRQDPRSVELRRRYEEHIGRMFELAGQPPATAARHAETILRIETELARGSMPVVERRDPYNVYHRIDRAGLEQAAPRFPWSDYFDALGSPTLTPINVAVPGFFRGLDRLVATTSTEDLRTYLRWHLLDTSAGALGARFVDEDF